MTSKRSSAVVQIAVNGTTATAGSPPLVHAGGVSNPSRVGLNNNASGGLMASMIIDVEEARSPRGGGRAVINYDDDDSEEDLRGIWENVLNRASFPPEHVKEYSATLSKQLVDLQLFSNLSNEDLNHLNIRLGHRKRIRRVVADAIVVREKQRAQSIAPRNALAGGFPKKHSIDDSSSPPHAGLTVSNSVAECAAEQDEYMARFPNSKLFYSQQHDITWLRVSGSWPSYTEFIDDMKTMRAYKGFPMSFDRLLFDDKPMPFFVTDNSDTMLGLLLRIPDLTDRYGTSVASITNRLVFMANFDQRFLLTYHNCAVNPLKVFEADWEKNLFTQKTLPQLLDSATRRALKAYSVGVFQMREEMDDLMAESYDGSEVDRVQGLTRIQKKAGVYKRCSEGCRDVISQLDRFETIAPYTKTLCEGLSTVESMADEAQSNALSSIDLTIAISEFKGSFNLKIFTYMTILLQPVSVMTSWYGMNWSNMPELLEENGYFIFTGIIWAVALVIFVMIVFGPDWISQLRPYFMHDAPRIVDEDESLDVSKGDAMTPTGKKEKRESGIALLSLPVAIGSGESTSSTSQRPADKHENSASGKLFSPLVPEQTSHNVLAGAASDERPLPPTASGDDDAAEIFPFIAEDAQSVDMSR